MKTKVLNFSDYKSFLRSFHEEKKLLQASWTYGRWAQLLKLGGTSVLTMIINGNRHPGSVVTQKLIRFFDFNKSEEQHFKNLVLLQKVSTDPELSLMVMENIQKAHPNKDFKLIDDQTFRSIAHWHYYTIREMVHLADFREDANWIAKKLRFAVTPLKIKKAIKDLLELGFLERVEGKLQQKMKDYYTEDDISNEALKRFHEQMIDHAKKSLRSCPVESREIRGFTLCVDQTQIEEMKESLRKLEESFSGKFEKPNGSNIYQLNIQFFPLTQ